MVGWRLSNVVFRHRTEEKVLISQFNIFLNFPINRFCYFITFLILRTSTEWIQVSNHVKPGGNFVLLDLDPAQWYHLRVTAHNNAGFNVAEYEFATLTVTGGKVVFVYMYRGRFLLVDLLVYKIFINCFLLLFLYICLIFKSKYLIKKLTA